MVFDWDEVCEFEPDISPERRAFRRWLASEGRVQESSRRDDRKSGPFYFPPVPLPKDPPEFDLSPELPTL